MFCVDDKQPWGYQTKEGTQMDEHTVMTTSVPDLMARHNVSGFEFMKMDIENAEYRVFGENEDLSWLTETQLLAVELHGNGQDKYVVVNTVRSRGLVGFTHGEYTFFSSSELAFKLGIGG